MSLKFDSTQTRGATLAASVWFIVIGFGAAVFSQTGSGRQEPLRATTADEIAHARLHDVGFEGRPSILESGSVTIRVEHPTAVAGRTVPYASFLQAQVCGSDAVVVATVQASRSMLNDRGTFIFTDYRVEVSDVFRAVPALSRADTITVSRIGGTVRTGEKFLKAEISDSPPLVPRRRYILFLKSLSAGRDFKSNRELDLVEDQGRTIKVSPVGPWSPREFLTSTPTFESIVADIKLAAAKCQEGRR